MLFKMVVWTHNSSTHRLSQLPSHTFICAPEGRQERGEETTTEGVQLSRHETLLFNREHGLVYSFGFGNDEK